MDELKRTLLMLTVAAAALLPSGPLRAQPAGAQPPQAQAPQVQAPQAQQPQAQPPPAQAALPDHPAIEPAAVAMLKATSKRLASLSSMSFTANSTYESLARTGQPLYYMTQSRVTVQHPNKLRVLTPGDGPASDFYYDGKRMMAYSPATKLVAVADAPPTMDGMLLAAYDKAAIYFPFASLLSDDPYKLISDGLTSAFVVGQSRVVDDLVTDIVAFTNKNVQAEVWIGINDGLPRMYRVTYLRDPEHLRYEVSLFNWRVNDKLQPSDFNPVTLANSHHMQFSRPDAPPPEKAK